MKLLVSLFSSLLVFTSVSAAHVPEYTSRYSDLDFSKCDIAAEANAAEGSEIGFVTWRCAGAYGYDVYATEADLRLYLAYTREGEDAPEEVGQTVAFFNTLGAKLEWRAPNRSGEVEPFATIVRYKYQLTLDDGTFEEGQVLVVSRFRERETCHVAYIDARANANANLMAREVADKFASGGSCPEGAVPFLGSGGDDFRF